MTEEQLEKIILDAVTAVTIEIPLSLRLRNTEEARLKLYDDLYMALLVPIGRFIANSPKDAAVKCV